MPNLRMLSLVSAKVDEAASLEALSEIPSLKVFHTAYSWPRGALKSLARARPELWINGSRGNEVLDFDELDWRPLAEAGEDAKAAD